MIKKPDLLEEVERRVALDPHAPGDLLLRGAVHLSDRLRGETGTVLFAQHLGSSLVFRLKFLAMATIHQKV